MSVGLVLRPIESGLIRTCHYWLTSTWTLLESQYWARPYFHNEHGTTPVLPDKGSVLTISTAHVLAEYVDGNASTVLACQYSLTTAWQYQLLLITITRDCINNKWQKIKIFNLFISILLSTHFFVEFLL